MGNASQGMMLVGRSSKDIKRSAVGQFVFANRLAHGDDHGGDDEAGVHSNGDDEACRHRGLPPAKTKTLNTDDRFSSQTLWKEFFRI